MIQLFVIVIFELVALVLTMKRDLLTQALVGRDRLIGRINALELTATWIGNAEQRNGIVAYVQLSAADRKTISKKMKSKKRKSK
jgi:hypothetical protein